MRHSLLLRQIRKHLTPEASGRAEFADFLDAVDAAYRQSDVDRLMLERSLELSSQELLQASSEMRGVFQALPDLFLRLDASGRIVDYKASSDVDLYVASGALVGKRIQDVPVAELGRRFADALEEVRSGKGMAEIVYRLDVGGSERWYEARLIHLFDEQVLAIIRNVTEVRSAEEERRRRLERAERQQSAIVELSTSDALSGHDLDAAFDAILRGALSGLEASHASLWLLTEDRRSLRRVAERGEPEGEGDRPTVLSLRRHPDYHTALRRAAPVASGSPSTEPPFDSLYASYLAWTGGDAVIHAPVRVGGRLAGALWLHDTRPGRHWHADQLTFAGVMADQAAKALLGRDRRKQEAHMLRTQKLDSLGVLAGGIAHDFNNTLTGILGNLSLVLSQTDEASEVAEALREAEAATRRATSLTRQLLTFAAGGKPVKATMHIDALVQESVTFALRGSNVGADLRIAPDLPPVDIDPGQIGQAIHNLVLNADQAMPHGGTLEVRAELVSQPAQDDPAGPHVDFVQVSVKDRGRGIPQEDFHSIFDPYFTTKRGGTGLGLASTHSILSNHGGEIDFESEVGVGSTFRLRLRASRNAVSSTEVGPIPADPLGGRILVMDDEAAIRDVVERMLERLGYEVTTSRHGEEAVRFYEEARDAARPYDAVLLDLTIPGGTGGLGTLERLREIDPGVRAVVCSGYSNDPVMAEFREHGFGGVIVKPFRLEDLATALDGVLGRTAAPA